MQAYRVCSALPGWQTVNFYYFISAEFYTAFNIKITCPDRSDVLLVYNYQRLNICPRQADTVSRGMAPAGLRIRSNLNCHGLSELELSRGKS